MKKFYISIISTVLCVQQIQSMELATPTSSKKTKTFTSFKEMNLTTPSDNDDGYIIITKNIADRPTPTPVYKQFDAPSEKLFKDNITDTEIRKLVTKEGAKLNYQKQGWNGPLIFYYASKNSPQDVTNMRTIIGLGAAFHNIEDEEHTPLTIALEQDHFLDNKKDFSAMIQLLIPHENPIVTIYEKTEDRDGEPFSWITYSQEQKIREYLISCSFYYPNITTIKMLLDLKLMTASRGLKAFSRQMKPNKEVLDLLLAYKAHNGGEVLPKVMYDTFPYDQYIEFMRQMCAAKVFNKEVLKRMQTIKKDVDAIVQDLEANEPK